MLKRIAGIAVFVLAAAGSPAALGQGQGLVTLFDAKDFRGRAQAFGEDVPDLRGTRIGRNAASSVRITSGCRAILYSEPGYRGRSMEIAGDLDNLRGSSIGNDAVSSLRIECGQRDPYPRRREEPETWGVTLYRGPGYRGRSMTFTTDVRNLNGSALGNDSTNSVRVSPGCRVVLYGASDFRGNAAELVDDTPDLSYTDVGGDAVSSLRVRCDRRDGGDRRHGDRGYDRGRGREPELPTLFSEYDFQGRAQPFDRDVANLEGSLVGNDAARSVRVPRGCRVTLYEASDFRGRYAELTHDEPDLSRTPVMDNTASSIRVRCDWR